MSKLLSAEAYRKRHARRERYVIEHPETAIPCPKCSVPRGEQCMAISGHGNIKGVCSRSHVERFAEQRGCGCCEQAHYGECLCYPEDAAGRFSPEREAEERLARDIAALQQKG